ncbi:PSD1 and planctomycete cytochrome C domain-containing protein [Pirellulales bacterium]|nr:PSD1 and planctomycete cytochrome C domain-containing protein [Pirellulales bacterium]
MIHSLAIRACLVSFHLCMVASAQDVAVDENAKKSRDASDVEFFEKQIAPILKRRCYECHSHESGKAQGGLVLDSRNGWKKGGSEGPAIVPGKPGESLLIEAVRHEGYEMPPEEQLPASEIALLEKWVAMGAPDPRESITPKVDPEKLWALQPIANSSVPIVNNVKWPRDDLDAFILARLDEEGLRPAIDADRYSLLRRVTFDLTGLPPTPDEIEAFVSDQSDRAYETVVDRLLESPGFGDHWARHWFDLSCYADLAGIQGNVVVRDAWRYRDYVIAAFNSDKPLDRFIHEQIAGDLLPYTSVEQQREQIIATGYLAIGPWTLQNYIKGQMDADVVDHQIDRIGRTFLGQTLSCARCHDHKFDPVPTRDYYALAGIFHSTLTTSYDGPGVWSQITHVALPVLPGAADIIREMEGLTKRLESARHDRAEALAVKDVETPSDSPIYRRGDFQSLGDIVPRGFVDAVSVSKNYDIPPATSGRVQLAHWLTDRENPLTSRVLVNRVWHHLFGTGLVRSVEYFGVHGETPSHPELLDFLAVRLREKDRWSLKTTVRRMALSRTYRMASAHNSRAAELDPDNRLLWQMPRRRLTAESIRDAMLAASGQFDPGRGGPSLGLELQGNIQGLGGNVNPPTWAGKIADYVKRRRSIYLPLKRVRPVGELEILSAFDFPHPNEITGARPNTTVATQALFLLNAPFVKHQANKLAERLTKEEPNDEQARVIRLYLLTVSRPADATEIETALTFLDQCTQEFASGSGSDNARSAAWTQLCHAVLGSNSFLFRE